ncbi:serine-type D-Ala-D-Ala carboxypeptidase [Vibrio sp. 10N.286.49.B3]|uniref:serine-type D-Ala-D-Ala carboxypeptidase n=1 Tax=Vibrio sp. 10N.286.49.B3 TaxID=1880855 RepID=UPI0018E453D8|nr:serine-type D-Ala-D-Ala carboxypeptidase [Vibrio sp. 10N.286.49.B3]
MLSLSLIMMPSLLLSNSVQANDTLPSNIKQHLPTGSRNSILLQPVNASDLQVTESNRQLFPPASTLKLVTALAAKLALEDSFHYSTQLKKQGSDIIIHFSGDPTLSRNDLKKLLSQLAKTNNNTIKGDLWLDNRAFSGYERAPGWPWDILGVCYSAPSSAITLEHNCVQGSLYSNNNGTTRVHVPKHQPIEVTSKVTAVSRKQQQDKMCDLDLSAGADNHYHLSGCMIKREKPLPLKFAVQDTAQYTSQVITALLQELNIRLTGSIKVGAPNNKAKINTLAQHHSDSLHTLLIKMLQQSDNLIADNLTKTLGAHYFNQPGSFTNGSAAIKAILLEQAQIDLSQAQIVDGSGLSRSNRMSSHQMAQVLRYIWQHDKQLNLVSAMPTAGINGTLRYRPSMRKAPIKGQIMAKSGSLYGSYNMAGFGLDEKGQPSTLFVQFVSDYFPSNSTSNTSNIAPITSFEIDFYQAIIKQSK